MTTVTQTLSLAGDRPVFVCDFSPPRGADLSTVAQAKDIGADFLCVAYSPGKSVRVDSTVIAHLLARGGDAKPPPFGERKPPPSGGGIAGQGVIFNLACRDMNRLAIQNHLLGAQLLGLENVVVLQGDGFTEKEREAVKGVNDYQPAELIRDIQRLNRGEDFRGGKLRAPTAFCVGAVVDFSKGLDEEARRAARKVESGADFFLSQTFWDVVVAGRFHDTYQRQTGSPFPKPIFYGLPVPAKDGILFGQPPEWVRRDLEQGRPGADIAGELLRAFLAEGLRAIYLVPPILRSGRRDYGAARDVLAPFKG